MPRGKKRRLTFREESRIKHAINDKIMHFSPTISPAPKDVETNEVECLRKAIEIFLASNEDIIIQPKYMGSYCDIYLMKNIEETKLFSRRGYPIRSTVPREELIEAVRPLWERFNWEHVTCRVVQSELMPWSTLGQELIERDFGGYGVCHRYHLDYLKESGLSEQVDALKELKEYQEYVSDKDTLTKKELAKKYPHHVLDQFKALASIDIPELKEYEQAIDLYDEQLSIYGKSGPIEFKPFNLLKTVFDSGAEDINTDNMFGWHSVTDEKCYIIHGWNVLDPENLKEAISGAYDWFNSLVTDKMEGVVVKPRKIWNKEGNTPPMFKVRNNSYLQMIYGVNFNRNYSYYLERRRVGKKIKCSINEWNIAQSLLRIPMSEISEENKTYTGLVRARILEEDFELELDSRL